MAIHLVIRLNINGYDETLITMHLVNETQITVHLVNETHTIRYKILLQRNVNNYYKD